MLMFSWPGGHDQNLFWPKAAILSNPTQGMQDQYSFALILGH